MNKIMVIVLALSMVSVDGFAKKFNKSKARASGLKTGDQMGKQLSGDAQADQGVQTTEYDSLQKSSEDSLKNSQKGKATALIMYGALGAAAQYKFELCSKTSGFGGYAACIAGGVLLGMSLQSKESADSFDGPIQNSWDNLCTYNNAGCAGTDPVNPYNNAVGNISDVDLEGMNKILKSKGIGVDPKTGIVKTPKGETINPSNPSSMAAVMGEAEAGALMSDVSSIEKDAVAKVEQISPGSVTAALGFEGGGGGGEIGTVAGYEEPEALNAKALNSMGKGLNLRKPAQLSGLSKNFNGDPIGVASDSIFQMMSRRYHLKSTQKSFIGKDTQ